MNNKSERSEELITDMVDSSSDKLISLIVNGRRIEARPEDNLATALWSNGYVDFGQDPISGQKRTVYCGIGQCGQCLVTVDGIEDLRACRLSPREGMRIEFSSENPDREEDHDR